MTYEVSPLTRKILEFSFLPGVGSAALRRITSSIATGIEVDKWNFDEVLARFARPSTNKSATPPAEGAERVLDACATDSQGILSALDRDYPAPLRHIEDFPPLLFFKGSVSALHKRNIAVVGTREVSRLGKSWARQISKILAQVNICTVSGLALGVDTAAHEGALAGSGVTVAVMAHGLDRVSPSSNKELARHIVESGGALVSEHPPFTPPRKPEYVRRNRLQSGMSIASIVVESGEIGGSIYQGRFTHEQGRILFCVNPPEHLIESREFRYGGARKLISDYEARSLRKSEDLNEFIRSKQFEELFDHLNSSPWSPQHPCKEN